MSPFLVSRPLPVNVWRMTLILTVLGLEAASGQPAQVLQWQPAEASVSGWQRQLTPEGETRELRVLPGAAEAPASALPLPPGRVRWAGVFPDRLFAAARQGLQVLGDWVAEPPRVEEVSALQADSAPLPLPAGRDIGVHMAWTAFGVEERVASLPEQLLGWRLRPGKRPAGLYSAAAWRLPARPRSDDWRLELQLRGRGVIQVGLAGATPDGYPDPESLQALTLREASQTHRLRIPGSLVTAPGLRVSLVADNEVETELVIESLRWVPGEETPSAAAAPALEYGVWDWSANPSRWRQFEPLWKQAGIRVLQLALPRVAGATEPTFGADLQALRQAGFEIVAVEGDPHMVLPETRTSVRRQHELLAGWQGRLIDAVQYDVEPYLLPGFQLQAERWYRAWGDFFEDFAGSAQAPLEAVVPFWLLGQAHGPDLLRRLTRSCRRVVVMNYRSEPVEALAWATAWLEWSRVQRHPVALALECGPVADVPQAVFQPAPRGRLWLAPWAGQGTAVVLFDEDIEAAGREGGVVCAQVRQGVVRGSRTSLQEQPPEAVAALLRELAAVAAGMGFPPSQQPRLLLHEPSAEVLGALAR